MLLERKVTFPHQSSLTNSRSACKEIINLTSSLARQAIRALREDNKIAPSTEYHSRFCTFVRTAKFAAEQAAEKKEAPAKGEGKKGKTQQA